MDGLGLRVRGLLGHRRLRGGHAQVALHDSGELIGALAAFGIDTEVAVAGSLAVGFSVHPKRPLGGVGPAQGLQELFVGDAAERWEQLDEDALDRGDLILHRCKGCISDTRISTVQSSAM